MKDIVVLGGSGMLGSMLTDVLARGARAEHLVATVRNSSLAERCCRKLPMVEWRVFDASTQDGDVLRDVIGNASWVINGIGLTKPYTHDDNVAEVERAIQINALLAHRLATLATETGMHILQIATDCVYSGARGHYAENMPHDATDVYGKTKSLGEWHLSNMHCLRCSIIGPEPKNYVFLLEWLRRQPRDAQVQGYSNHNWNGVTTLQFARVCQAVINNRLELPPLQHLIPCGEVAKEQLLRHLARAYGREDITIIPTDARTVVDRTLATTNETMNRELWEAAGYEQIPSVPDMVCELARYEYRMEGI